MPRRKAPDPDPPPHRQAGTGSVSWSAKRRRWRARLPRREGESKPRESWHLTTDEAAAWIAHELAKAPGTFDSRRPTGEYLDYWRGLHKSRWSPQTQLRYEAEANAYPKVRVRPLERLRGDEIMSAQESLLGRGRSRRYVNQCTRLLHRALADAVKWKILAENVAETVTPPTPERKRARAWSLDEIRLVLKEIVGHRFEAAYLLIIWAGLRIGEVLAMRWDKIGNDGVVTVDASEQTHIRGRPIGTPKREREREVDIPLFVVARLKQLRDRAEIPSLYVLGRPDGRRWLVDNVRADWVALVKQLGVREIGLHGGRRSFGTMHMLAGTSLADLSELMGHAGPDVTARSYIASDRERRKAAAERLVGLLYPQSDPGKGQTEGQQPS